jgi:hypothetical protein
MATIVQNIVGDQALSLGREELIRAFDFGSNWTQIRVAIWCSLPGSGNLSSAQLSLGVCKGTTNGLRAASSEDALAVTFGPATSTWTYAAGPPPVYTVGSGGIGIVQRVGVASTTASNANSTARISAGNQAPVLFAIDFLRTVSVGAPLIRWSGYCRTDANVYAGTAATLFDRYRAADWQRSWSSGVIQIPYVSSPGSQFASFSHSGVGFWDSVNVSWTHDSPALEINNLIVVRFSA